MPHPVIEVLKKLRGNLYLQGLDLPNSTVNNIKKRRSKGNHDMDMGQKDLKAIGKAMGIDYRYLLPQPDYKIEPEYNDRVREQVGWGALLSPNENQQQLMSVLKDLHLAAREYIAKNTMKEWIEVKNNVYRLGASLRLTVYPGDFYELWVEYGAGRQTVNCKKMAQEVIEIIQDKEEQKYLRVNRVAKGCEKCVCGLQF